MAAKWGQTEKQRRIDRQIARAQETLRQKWGKEMPLNLSVEIEFMREALDEKGLAKVAFEGEQAIWMLRIYDWLPGWFRKRVLPKGRPF